jgi:hypothetical protein
LEPSARGLGTSKAEVTIQPAGPNGGSGVLLESKSRNLLCQVLDESVAGIGRFTDPSTGVQHNLVSVNPVGSLHFGGGDLDEIDVGVG